MLTIIRNGKRVKISRELEHKGAAAVEEYVTAQAGAIKPRLKKQETPAGEAPTKGSSDRKAIAGGPE